MDRIFTLREARKLDACPLAIKLFKHEFGEQAPLTAVIQWLREINRSDWEALLLAQTLELTQAVLDAGADVHARDDEALCWAAELGRTEVVKLLLKAGADVHARDDEALYRAAEFGHTETVKLLKEAMSTVVA